MADTTPCGSCPWRKSNPAGGDRIPNFSLDLMRKLRNTTGQEDGFRSIMACHHSACGDERPCIGYVAVEGWRNLNVRVLAFQGHLDLAAIDAATKDIPLWESFEAMLQAFEDALAERPAVKACPWGRCNGTAPAGGRCNRCGTPVDFPYTGQTQR